MTILTHDAILDQMRNGKIEIAPFSESQVGPASIDLHVDNDFRVFKNARRVFDIREDAEIEQITEIIHVPNDGGLMLMPGKSCLGVTVERLKLSANLCGWLQGRSRFARLGLVVHATASFIQPGVNNKQVLEISNVGQIPLNVIPKVAICQVILEDCVGEAVYQGRFREQILP
jgi:dCTP deaminase